MDRRRLATLNVSDVNAHVQIMQSRVRLRAAGLLLSIVAALAALGFTATGVSKWRDWGLAGAAGIALAFQYCKERALIRNRLAARGVVTAYHVPLSKTPRIIRLLTSHFVPQVPRIKYSFVAFDQKTYTGEAGWNAAGLRVGLPIPILYNPENPAKNYPLTSFVFHSLY